MITALNPYRLPWPTEWHELFGRQAPLLMEIGFGGGYFLQQLAIDNPTANVLGLEISLPSVRKVERKLARSGPGNVRLVHATGQMTLRALCKTASIRGLYINFPDPWPKAAHHSRRLVDDSFLALSASRLAVGATLQIATDHAEYAYWIADCLGRSPHFSSQNQAPYKLLDCSRLGTKYEQKALVEGRSCYYFSWQRNGQEAADRFPVPKELPMPHAVISTPLSLGEIAQAFRPRTYTSGTIHVRLIELYCSLSGEGLAIDTYIGEDPFEQRVLLAITPRKQGDILVHMTEVGYPRPTPGMHAAINDLVEWLLTLSPATRLHYHNLQRAAGNQSSGQKQPT
jgi:tRNA (guanine-N7-)-methyltransferase